MLLHLESPACMVWYLDLPPPSVVRAGVDRVGVVDVMAGVFCGVDGNVKARVGISCCITTT